MSLIDSIIDLANRMPAELELPDTLKPIHERTQYRDVFIAMPTGDGKTEVQCMVSILEAMHIAKNKGYQVQFVAEPMCIYIGMARNKLVMKFLKSGATDLFFIDADQGFDPQGFMRVLERDELIVGGVPPMKSDSGRFPGLLFTDENGRPSVNPATGLIEAAVLGTGFMRIKREAILSFIEHYREGLEVIERDIGGGERCRYWNIFDTRQVGTDWFGEDVFFGRRWQEMGGKLWVDPDITFTHIGTKSWQGNLHDHLRALPGGGGEKPSDWNFEVRT